MPSASAASPSFPRTASLALRQPMVRQAGLVLLASLFVAVCAHIEVPLWFTPVPLTLQTFAVLLIGLLLSPGAAAAAMLLYLGEGMCGLPAFSPVGSATFLHLFGPTGGYLLSYPAAAGLTAWLRQRLPGQRFVACFTASAIGSVLILLSGAAWFAILTHQSAATVLTLTVLPFLPGDVIKLAAAAGIASGWRRFRRA
jgi:biotin transport system substrate-specific component